MKAGSLRALPKAVTPENAPVSDRNGNFQDFLRTFEIASREKFIKSRSFINDDIIYRSQAPWRLL